MFGEDCNLITQQSLSKSDRKGCCILDASCPDTNMNIRNNPTLPQVTIPSSVSLIERYAFSECSSLKQITFQSQNTSLNAYVFNECSSLIEISFDKSSSVRSIGKMHLINAH